MLDREVLRLERSLPGALSHSCAVLEERFLAHEEHAWSETILEASCLPAVRIALFND